MIILKISEPVLKTVCHFYITDERNEMIEAIEKKFKFAKTDENWKKFCTTADDANGIHTAAISHDGYEDIIWLEEEFTVGLLAHEIEHMISNKFNYIGMPHTQDTDEMFAYYLTWAIDEFYKKYSKILEKSKKNVRNKN